MRIKSTVGALLLAAVCIHTGLVSRPAAKGWPASNQLEVQLGAGDFAITADGSVPTFVQSQDKGAAAVRSAVELMHVQSAWDLGLHGEGMVAAVLDTGIFKKHPDLAGADKILHYEQVDKSLGDPEADKHGHGTHVAGIIAANGQAGGVVGIAPKAKLVCVKVLDDAGLFTLSDALKGLLWVEGQYAKLGISVVNISFSTHNLCTTPPAFDFDGDEVRGKIRQSIKRLADQGVIVVAACGNQGYCGAVGFPAICPETVSVTSAAKDAYWRELPSFPPFRNRILRDQQGAPEFGTDLAAPGENITSTWNCAPNSVRELFGTSMAAPMASGAVLLVQQLYKSRKGKLPTAAEVERWLSSCNLKQFTANDVGGTVSHTESHALLDIGQVLDACQNDLGAQETEDVIIGFSGPGNSTLAAKKGDVNKEVSIVDLRNAFCTGFVELLDRSGAKKFGLTRQDSDQWYTSVSINDGGITLHVGSNSGSFGRGSIHLRFSLSLVARADTGFAVTPQQFNLKAEKMSDNQEYSELTFGEDYRSLRDDWVTNRSLNSAIDQVFRKNTAEVNRFLQHLAVELRSAFVQLIEAIAPPFNYVCTQVVFRPGEIVFRVKKR
ncbi:MAG: S8 family serine peptidase [Planctomycetes bacterium]|nr:S8 family serine peptidase [Planctomycetota bacterium]